MITRKRQGRRRTAIRPLMTANVSELRRSSPLSIVAVTATIFFVEILRLRVTTESADLTGC
jgi:hypothetical protein